MFTNNKDMKKFLSLIFVCISFYLFSQNNPVAVDDTTQVMNQKLIEIYPLLNDYDPDGDSIFIRMAYSANHGEEWHNDSIVFYQSEWHEGWDAVKYKIAKVNDPSYESERAYIRIEVMHNPDVPVALNDTLPARLLEPTVLDILANDHDPNGDDIKILEIWDEYHCTVEILPDSTSVLFRSGYPGYLDTGFKYKIGDDSDEQYHSKDTRVVIINEENPDIPVTVNDTFEVTGGIPAMLDVLANDHDPLGDTIEFYDMHGPSHGQLEIIDYKFHYTANTSYKGEDFIYYTIRYKNKPWLRSREARVHIVVDKNPDCPIGVPDHGSGMAYTEVAIEVLSNDYDPLGDSFEIMDVYASFPYLISLYFSGDTVYYTSPVFINGPDTIYYAIRKTDNTAYHSEWIPIILDLEYNPAYPKIINDTVSVKAGSIIRIDFWENDIFQDSIEITNVLIQGNNNGRIIDRTDSVLWYCPFSRSNGPDSIYYHYYTIGHPAFIFSQGWIFVDVEENHSYDSLTINNINAGLNSSGMQFSRINENPWEDGIWGSRKQHFEVPKGSGNHTMYKNTLWIGGVDDSGQLHLAAERYRHVGTDIQPGPVQFIDYDSTFFDRWNRMWNLRKEDVEHHIMNWWKEGYEPIEPIASWPGNGDPEYNIPAPLAPYHDHDGNGIYDPGFGDYPLIRGDQCIYFICNDVKMHSESQGMPLYVEIHGMAYAYDAPGDSILNNTVFVHYDLINRSENTYYDTYFGIDNDFDLGYPWDDFVGSHVMGNSFFAYNGMDPDGSGEPEAYDEYPPAQSVTFLAGPFIDPDGQDNPSGGCDHSINGLNFDNGIADDERHGLSYFMFYGYGAGSQGEPNLDIEYWTYLHGIWKDGSPIRYGYSGYGDWASGPDCRYMFPGVTDPMNWGTECVLPNDGYTLNGKWWTMEDEGFIPTDVTGLGTCGPFTFHPGDVQEVDMAYVFANSYHSADSSKNLLIERLYELRQRTLDGEIIIPNNELSVNEVINKKPSFNIYPNPAGDLLNINYSGIDDATFSIVNTMGTMVLSGRIEKGSGNSVNVKSLNPGVYIICITSEKTVSSKKFVKY